MEQVHPMDFLPILQAAVRKIVSDPSVADLSARQLDVLLMCHTAPRIERTVKQMAATMNVSKPSITRALDRLADLKMVKRELNQDDRRAIFANITPTGRNFVIDLHRSMSMAMGTGR